MMKVWYQRFTVQQPYQLTNPVQDEVNDFLANGVMASSIIVGSILLASDQLLRMKELAVGASANLV